MKITDEGFHGVGEAAIGRAEGLISDTEIERIPDAGHALNFAQPEIVDKRILDFLKKDAHLPEILRNPLSVTYSR
jgi:pimeloyl-ACP methyl ester carboxylesterase